MPFLFLHHFCPGNLQRGWLACPADTQTLVLLVLLLLNPLLSNHWLLLDHHGFTFTRDTAIPQKQLLNSPRCRALISVVSKASGRSLFDHSFRPYIYVFIQKNRIIRRICTPAKIHIRSYEYGYGEKIMYNSVYIWYKYIQRI